MISDVDDDNRCTQCGEPNDGGEGYDGLCGNCADAAYLAEEVSVPHPDNPFHIENLKTIPLLEAQGFQGSDASLEISLFEYDCIWREVPTELRDHSDEDYLFVFRVGPGKFARVGMMSCDFEKDFNWMKEADWGSFLSTHGAKLSEWMSLPYPQRIHDLFSYWGYMNVFGETIWGAAFKIKDPQNDEEAT